MNQVVAMHHASVAGSRAESALPTGRHDLSDTHAVIALAAEIAAGDCRRITLVSVAELRAVATLALRASEVVEASCHLFGRSDQGASKDELLALLRMLSRTTRPFLKEP